MSNIPPVGTEAYKRLPFYNQLEIAALQLFSPNEYADQVGEVGEVSPSTDLFDLSYPEQAPFSIEDLPVSFLHRYWAGYKSSFKEEWYINQTGSRGVTPLDEFDLDVGYLVNVRTFNFSFLSLTPAVHYIFTWVRSLAYSGDTSDQALLDACKVYTYLAHHDDIPVRISRRGKVEPNPIECYLAARNVYDHLISFDELNEYHPMVEPCEELDYITWNDYSIVAAPKFRRGRWYYPCVPAKLFSARKFSIKEWDFIDPQ